MLTFLETGSTRSQHDTVCEFVNIGLATSLNLAVNPYSKQQQRLSKHQ